MRFRRLSKEELSELEKDFVSFLASNTVTASDWEKLKSEDKARAEDLIDMFSDIVFETSLKKIEYLENCSAGSLLLFKCEDEQLSLLGVNSNDAEIDFTQTDFVSKLKDNSLSVFYSQKPYSKNREEEVFEMLEQGCSITDGKLFESLKHISQ